MMGHYQTGIAILSQQFIKPLVPEFSGSHLCGQALLRSICLGVKKLQVQFHSKLLRQGTDKLFISVAFLSPKAKIARGNAKGDTRRTQQVREHRAIYTPTRRKELLPFSIYNVLFPYMSDNSL